MTRLLPAVALLGILTSGTAACSTPNVCPAIGWSNSATVILDGEVEAVHVVEFCDEGSCSVLPSEAPRGSMKSLSPAPGPTAGAPVPTATAAPPQIHRQYIGRKVDGRTWQFSALMSSPERVTVRALSANGEVLAERDVDLEWKRIGGSAECGGPATAGPINLAV
jgi:hypothetical protein